MHIVPSDRPAESSSAGYHLFGVCLNSANLPVGQHNKRQELGNCRGAIEIEDTWRELSDLKPAIY